MFTQLYYHSNNSLDDSLKIFEVKFPKGLPVKVHIIYPRKARSIEVISYREVLRDSAVKMKTYRWAQACEIISDL